MRPKPIVKTGFVVACFDGEQPRFLCRDRKHGHYVVTTDAAVALSFEDEGDADEAREEAGRVSLNSPWVRGGAWRTWRMASRFSFEDPRGARSPAADRASGKVAAR